MRSASPTVQLASWDLSSVDLVDERTGVVLATLLPLDTPTPTASGACSTRSPTWMEMAFDGASGTPCLGAFAVHDAGAVLLYMAGTRHRWSKARPGGICRHRGLDLGALPVHLITAPALRPDRAQDQARLGAIVAKCVPRLLVLDPLVRLYRIDE